MIKTKHILSFVAFVLALTFIISTSVHSISASMINKMVNKSYFDENKTKIKSMTITRKSENLIINKEIVNYNLNQTPVNKYVINYSNNKLKLITKYEYKNNKFIKVKNTYYYNTHTNSKKVLNNAYAIYNYKSKKKIYLTKTAKRNEIVAVTKKMLGKPYVSGGKTPKGFDCSGLTSYVYKKAVNKKLGASSLAQNNQGKYVSRISAKSLKPGDVLFWGSKSSPYHVGIYIGNGQYIHAETYGVGVKKRALLNGGFTPNYAKRMI